MYTPYGERHCPLCLSLHIPGDEIHTLLHCPLFSPLTQPAIDSLMLNLRQFAVYGHMLFSSLWAHVECCLRKFPSSIGCVEAVLVMVIVFRLPFSEMMMAPKFQFKLGPMIRFEQSAESRMCEMPQISNTRRSYFQF